MKVRDEAATVVVLIGVSMICACLLIEALTGSGLWRLGYLGGCLVVALGSLIYKKRIK